MVEGLGYVLDMDLFDRMVNIQSTPARAEVFDSPGSVWHLIWGAASGLMPGAWPVLGASAFAGYELSKADGGKPFTRIAGGMLEFALGLGIGLLIARAK
jgi:hypothetical protein